MHPSGGRDAGRAVARAVVLLVAIGCSIDDGVRPGPPPPVVVASAVTANPDNVLAAVVTARARFADSVALYGLVIDNTGRVVWYHRFLNGPGLNFEAEPTGRYYARPPTPDRTDLEPWAEIDPLGNVTRTFGCAGGLQPRFHDLIAELDG